jgi:hypothetical protein
VVAVRLYGSRSIFDLRSIHQTFPDDFSRPGREDDKTVGSFSPNGAMPSTNSEKRP